MQRAVCELTTVAYHAVDSVKQRLVDAHFQEIKVWNPKCNLEHAAAIEIVYIEALSRNETLGPPSAGQVANTS